MTPQRQAKNSIAGAAAAATAAEAAAGAATGRPGPGEHKNVLDNDGLLRTILSFLPRTYRYTAAVNQKFRRNYEALFPNQHETSLEYAVEEINTTRICLAECTPTNGPRRSGEVERNEPRRIIGIKAAVGGHLHVLECLYPSGCEFDVEKDDYREDYREMIKGVVRCGHLHVLKWLHRHGDITADNVRFCYCAAYYGHLEVLKWLRANGFKWNEYTCSDAADGGRLDVLQWLRANGCPWGEGTCTRAAEGGHLDVLQWARANGCPWNAERCILQARDDVIRSWIISKRSISNTKSIA